MQPYCDIQGNYSQRHTQRVSHCKRHRCSHIHNKYASGAPPPVDRPHLKNGRMLLARVSGSQLTRYLTIFNYSRVLLFLTVPMKYLAHYIKILPTGAMTTRFNDSRLQPPLLLLLEKASLQASWQSHRSISLPETEEITFATAWSRPLYLSALTTAKQSGNMCTNAARGSTSLS
jgi:hypothetical protein